MKTGSSLQYPIQWEIRKKYDFLKTVQTFAFFLSFYIKRGYYTFSCIHALILDFDSEELKVHQNAWKRKKFTTLQSWYREMNHLCKKMHILGNNGVEKSKLSLQKSENC